ncbi:MAG: hypothetical protein K2X27_02900, partial [Candidatus Obscuribacterales bacterium]|nr:hypothetical protein [Candidatus Obscuribacterales bacterium]
TSIAFVLAAAGFKVAKFGGRAASGKSGSFDFLEILGIENQLPVQNTSDALSVCGLAFIFAPRVYPILKRLMPLRKAYGRPTVLNYIGPLLNPVAPSSRIMGISSNPVRKLVAQHLSNCPKTRKAMLVTSAGHLDELSIDEYSEISLIDEGLIHEFELDPSTLPFISSKNGAKAGEFDAQSNVRSFLEIVEGKDKGSDEYKMILLNSAAALFLLKACPSMSEGIRLAAELISAGSVFETVETCRRFYARLSD